MAIGPDVFTELKARPYKAVRPLVRDGDLLFVSSREPFSRLIRWATRSPWSHVGIAFRLKEIERVVVLDCVQKIGVRCVPLSTFVTRTPRGKSPVPGRIVLARHAGMAAKSRANPLRRMAEFAFDRLGDHFSQAEMLKIVARITLDRIDRPLHPSLGPDNEFICSEFVAKAFERVDIEFPWDGRGFIAPADIAADPRVAAIAQIRT
jgi:hypothetical protein